MALRAVTPGRVAYCSDCSTEVPPGAPTCPKCRRPFLGEVEALLCTRCSFFAPRSARECVNCGAKLLGVSDEPTRAGVREKLPEPARLWSAGSDPVQRVPPAPTRRLDAMDAVLARARNRTHVLESSESPIEAREREELRRHIEELLREREDVLKAGRSAPLGPPPVSGNEPRSEPLRDRGTGSGTRVEDLERELELGERERRQVELREHEVDRREDEFRRILENLRQREVEVEVEQDRLRRIITRVGQREAELRQRLAAIGPGLTQITIEEPDQAVSEMRVRIADLEEQSERLIDERNRLAARLTESDAHKEEIRDVLRVIDELLGKLPDAHIRAFARSTMFSAYERVLDRYGV